MKDLIQHLKGHIIDSEQVQCPFERCSSKFTVKSTFSSHLSRKHANAIDRKVSTDLLIEEPDSSRNNSDDLIHDNSGNVEINDEFACLNECDQDEPNLEADFNELFLKNLALFYLKLTAKHHMPATTIQMIVSEMK